MRLIMRLVVLQKLGVALSAKPLQFVDVQNAVFMVAEKGAVRLEEINMP